MSKTTVEELQERLTRYNFTDDHGHRLENCQDYQDLLEAIRQAERARVEAEYREQIQRIEKLWHDAAEEVAHQRACKGMAQSELTTLRARLPQWIGVDERLPREGQDVIACRPHDAYMRVAYLNDGKWYHAHYQMSGVTHWMELPEPPATTTPATQTQETTTL